MQSSDNLPISEIPAKKTKPWLTIVFLILLAISLGAISFFVYQNYQLKQEINQISSTLATCQEKPQPSPFPLLPQTGILYQAYLFGGGKIPEGEGTYKDEIYGFQIKIPNTWFISPTGGMRDNKTFPGDTFQAYNYYSDDLYLLDQKGNLSLELLENPIKIEIAIDTQEGKTLEQEKERSINQLEEANITYQLEDITFCDKPSVKFVYNYTQGLQWPKEMIVTQSNKGYMFYINYSARDGIEENRNIFDKILSSFEFLD